MKCTVNSKSNKGICMKFWILFMDCIKLHKLTVFLADAAENQRYMQQMIKKPQQVMVHQFVSCMGVLNDYLAYLPKVFDLLMAVAGTNKMNVSFDEADLAGIVLNLVPSSWVSQYNMTHSMLPKKPRALLNDLETIEQVATAVTMAITNASSSRCLHLLSSASPLAILAAALIAVVAVIATASHRCRRHFFFRCPS
jgi:hypothetical protein